MADTPIVKVTRAVPGSLSVPGAAIETLGEGLPDRGALLAFVEGASVLVSMHTDNVNDELLERAGPSLVGVCNYAVGFNNIDLTACASRGVAVSNTPDAVTEGTADIAWALILAAARRVVEGDHFVRSGAWQRAGVLGMGDFLGRDLTGRTLLIVGAGRIGLAVAKRGLAWGMRTLYVARSRHWEFELAPIAAERVSLEEGLDRADVVSVHTPLTEETGHLIGPAELARLKRTAILVNTARGPVVDEEALTAALESNQIFAAGLDVLEREPAIGQRLAALRNVVLTPHIGSAEQRYREEMTGMVAANAIAMLKGERPPNEVRTP
ncbi:MAG: D-glycerate dehydrogenase [Planctomycetota bacterium]